MKTMKDRKNLGIKSYKADTEKSAEERLLQSFQNCPLPAPQRLENLGLFLTSKNLSRVLFMHHLYQLIIPVQGVVMDLGTRWGQNAVLFSALRGIYEPFNRHRKIVAFDTFTGFPKISKKDGRSDLMKQGNISVTRGYENFLQEVMTVHEKLSPLSHLKKFELVAGDAGKTVPKYFKTNPETIVALAYFDFDLYGPTKKCLEEIRPRLVRGSVLGFDELNDPDSPGETRALMEVFGLNRVKLKRFPHASRVSYFVLE